MLQNNNIIKHAIHSVILLSGVPSWPHGGATTHHSTVDNCWSATDKMSISRENTSPHETKQLPTSFSNYTNIVCIILMYQDILSIASYNATFLPENKISK